MTFRAYLRTFDGRVPAETKTLTDDQTAAFAAFAALVNRKDLDGQRMAAALTRDNRQMAFHRFDRQPGDIDYWRDRLDELEIAPASDDIDALAAAYLERYRWPEGGVQALPIDDLRGMLRDAFAAGFRQAEHDPR